jgi:hypothetical protein
MYKIGDNKSANKAIQHYLAKIYGKEMSINKSGVFDDNTILALNEFQRDNAIDVNGYADYTTFNALYSAYINKTIADEVQADLPGARFPIKRGDKSPLVAAINDIMHEILDYYSIHQISPNGDYFSSVSEEAVEILRNIFGLDNCNVIDERLYSRLKDEHKSISLIKNCRNDYFIV